MKDMDSIDWSELFYLDPSTPSGLRRAKEWRTGSDMRILRANVGDEVGNKLTTSGYYSVKVQGRTYLCHRIVMCLNGHKINGKVIDHVDGNPENNKVENLRLSDMATNSQNRKLPTSNTSGVIGVSVNCVVSSNGTEHYRWRAEVHVSGVKTSRYFSFSKYGKELGFELACKWRLDKIKSLNEQGITNYTEQHGRTNG